MAFAFTNVKTNLGKRILVVSIHALFEFQAQLIVRCNLGVGNARQRQLKGLLSPNYKLGSLCDAQSAPIPASSGAFFASDLERVIPGAEAVHGLGIFGSKAFKAADTAVGEFHSQLEATASEAPLPLESPKVLDAFREDGPAGAFLPAQACRSEFQLSWSTGCVHSGCFECAVDGVKGQGRVHIGRVEWSGVEWGEVEYMVDGQGL
jgi:hypothetical protein